eukprot:NODE_24364_length_628_cov_2.618762.p2 GENE.NODE_24364_length_628_cov_2.618762~~NODE_24364_length_628_cov_2.618762.p2  ORF type:complete len:95 (+),score=22.79 NODE_24364_length_628_cov_2.618762:120-404(+)
MMEQLRAYREKASFDYKTRRFHDALNEHGERVHVRGMRKRVAVALSLTGLTGTLLLWFDFGGRGRVAGYAALAAASLAVISWGIRQCVARRPAR